MVVKVVLGAVVAAVVLAANAISYAISDEVRPGAYSTS
jgi:hypothetical protein